MTIRIWTDGCCLVNPGGPGGYAWIAVHDDTGTLERQSGGDSETTNNIQEMTAVITALHWWHREGSEQAESLIVYSDSQYVVKGINEWSPRWKENGWKKRKGNGHRGWKRPANLALWQELDRLVDRSTMIFEWVRGHSGHPRNEEADRLALTAAREAEREGAEGELEGEAEVLSNWR